MDAGELAAINGPVSIAAAETDQNLPGRETARDGGHPHQEWQAIPVDALLQGCSWLCDAM